jgi:hypothetical protein
MSRLMLQRSFGCVRFDAATARAGDAKPVDDEAEREISSA